jgi:hypothetical protein
MMPRFVRLRIARAQAARPFNEWIRRPENEDVRNAFRDALAEKHVFLDRRIAKIGAVAAVAAAGVMAVQSGDIASMVGVLGGGFAGTMSGVFAGGAHSNTVKVRQAAMRTFYDRLTPQLKSLSDRALQLDPDRDLTGGGSDN